MALVKQDKEDIRKLVYEVSIEVAEHVISVVQSMFDEQNKKNAMLFSSKKDDEKTKKEIKKDIAKITKNQNNNRKDIDDNRTLIENRVTRREFDELKKFVYSHFKA